MPKITLEHAMESTRRLHEIEDEIEVLQSRIGGQGTGVGTRIDHNTVLDVMRSVDDYIVAMEGDIPREKEWCMRDIDAGWVVLFGAERMMAEEGTDPAASDAILRALALRYMYGMPWDAVMSVNVAGIPGRELCAAATKWMEERGLAHIRHAARRS